MKIIKTIALSLAAVILAGCANNSVATAENGARIINRSQNISNHGELHLDTEERLKFMDYESMNDVFICSSPNCTHTDPESCSAFGMGNRQVLYNNYIYYITSEIVNNGDKLKSLMHICRAKTDGTERKTLITEEDFYEGVDSSVNALVSGDELYFCASENEFDQYGDTGFKKIYFFRVNMREEKLENIAKICEGYHAGVWIYGLWNKKIYFNYSAFDHELTEEEHKALDKSKIYI